MIPIVVHQKNSVCHAWERLRMERTSSADEASARDYVTHSSEDDAGVAFLRPRDAIMVRPEPDGAASLDLRGLDARRGDLRVVHLER
jgi:hypothetical protein